MSNLTFSDLINEAWKTGKEATIVYNGNTYPFSPEGLLDFIGTNNASLPDGGIDGQILGRVSGSPEWVDNVGYATGTWTPYMVFGTGTNADETYSAQDGTYIRIGNLVIASFYLVMTAKGTDTGAALLRGKPFTSITRGGSVQMGWYNNMALDNPGIFGFISDADPGVTLRNPTTSGMTGLTDANFTDTSALIGTLIYHTED